ncbi:F-box/LRR-repeat protein 3-like isoform X3 [Zootermopsis nevadensis]|uniref:F-box/LRR-repeat protein 3-like isoform X3 n=1 Tax=Zootermopsis nevadensis TaxID=136037 RepID=UPI000B8E664D|nr:F-box/LRR-repeat protein 3-like isoform X3 [Zootermopsis nevadensis]
MHDEVRGLNLGQLPIAMSILSKESQYCELGWSNLPSEPLLQVFSHLPVQDLGTVAQVCQHWNHISQFSQLWQRVEFNLSQASKSYLQPTPEGLINYILQHHAKHLKFVIFKMDSTVESAQMACYILSRLVNCSLKTLALISSARPVFLDMDQQSFISALTVVFDHSHTLSSVAIDNTPVDDMSLEVLASSNSRTLELLRMKSCPRVSPEGILSLADHCCHLRELTLSYTLLSDDLLLALSSEEHVCLEYLHIDVYTEKDMLLQQISPQCWSALVEHSPDMNLVMYFFVIPDQSFDTLFMSYTPVTHIYFGDHVPKRVLGRIGSHCPRLKELVVGANGNSFINDELLNIANNCPELSSLGLGECEVTCSAFVKFAHICGPRLKELYVTEECLVEDSQYDLTKACKQVSELIGRDWAPEYMPIW